MRPVYTIGHSTRTEAEFTALLTEFGVDTLVDVRTYPGSRHCPWFGRDVMPGWLDPIGYAHMPALGGRRRSCLEHSPNGWWTHPSFRAYADYAEGDEFAAGLDELLALAETRTCAIMCSEAVWWKCHRRIITDYLIAVAHRPVVHILGPGMAAEAVANPAAEIAGGALVYASATMAQPGLFDEARP